MVRAILDGAQQIAVPAFVSTLCICIVFVPVFFLSGVARFLFQPLAMAVIFAMLASYFLSRTVGSRHGQVPVEDARARRSTR
jgi:multidrug efflux pump subunit AcrB